MLTGYTRAIASAMPNASLFCYAGAAFVARKFELAFICKIGSIAAKTLRMEEYAEKLDFSSQYYWTEAKKKGIQDLTITISLIAWGLAASYAEEPLLKQLENQEQIKVPDEEQNNTQNQNTTQNEEPIKVEDPASYTFWNTLWNYPKTTLTVISVGILTTTWKLRHIFCSPCRLRLINKRDELVFNYRDLNRKTTHSNEDIVNMHLYRAIGDLYTFFINRIQKETCTLEWKLPEIF